VPALVVLGARNLGGAILDRFLADGWEATAIVRSAETAEAVEARGARAIRADVTDPAQLRDALDAAGPVDCLVNAVSVARFDPQVPWGGGPLVDATIERYRAWGADVVLLIVASLDQRDLVALREHAESLGMTALVEVHDEDETRRAVDAGAAVIGVNTRDLRTLEVDRAVFARVRRHIPDDVVTIAESGVRGVDDVRQYAAAGAHGVLVGEALVTGGDPVGTVRDFAAVGVRATPGTRSKSRVRA